MPEAESWRILIEGSRLHASDYRQWLLDRAREHALSGWARNRSDGAVEAILRGAPTNVGAVIAEAHAGGDGCDVAQVSAHVSDIVPKPGLRIRPTNEVTGLRRLVPSGARTAARRALRTTRSRRPDSHDGPAPKTPGQPGEPTSGAAEPEGGTTDLVQQSVDLDAQVKAGLDRWLQPARAHQISGEELDRLRATLREVTPFQVSYMASRRLARLEAPIGRGVSFQAKMVEISQARHTERHKAVWTLNDKAKAYRFIDALGVRRPQGLEEPVRLELIEPRYPCVVKNTRGTGSRGSYLVHRPDRIVHLADRVELGSWEELREHASDLMNPEITARRLRDRWICEDLITDPDNPERGAADVKLYAFYGQIKIVLEMRRDQGRVYSFTDADNQPIETGMDVELFQGKGVSPEEVDQIREISLSIPYPFMRIDMLRGSQGLVFGEFTPLTGDFDEFNTEVDRGLGMAWVEAESRLWADLMAGKRFEAFSQAAGLSA